MFCLMYISVASYILFKYLFDDTEERSEDDGREDGYWQRLEQRPQVQHHGEQQQRRGQAGQHRPKQSSG